MPCDSIRTVGVSLDKCDPPTMLAALTELGLSPRLHPNGHLIYFGNNETLDCQTGKGQFAPTRELNEVKRAYSTTVLKQTAKRNGWQLNPVPGKQDEYVMVKR